MTPRSSDAQLTDALRAAAPITAPAGLRDRILDAAARTDQRRALTRWLGGLADPAPTMPRRLMVAAALGMAILAVVAAVVAVDPGRP